MAPLEAALGGKITDRVLKPEYHKRQSVTTTKRVQA